MKEELRLLIKKTEQQKDILNQLISVKQTKSDLERFLTVRRFVDGFLEDLKKIEKL